MATSGHLHEGRRIAIIGGGVTGIAAFVALLENETAASLTAIDIIDPGTVGVGKAFATTENELLCNTSAETMSLIADDGMDFVKYLRGRGYATTKNSFVPRYQVSQYVRDRYLQFVERANAFGIAHRHVRSEARTIVKLADQSYQIALTDGRSLVADDVLICAGFGKPVLPESVLPFLDDPRFFPTPYPERELLTQIPAGSHVLVMGTRLSAIDTALLLCTHGYRVTMTSRTGELPAVRTRTPRLPPGRINERAFYALDPDGPRFEEQLLRILSDAATQTPTCRLGRQVSRSIDTVSRLRSEITLAAAGKTDWQDVLVNFLDLGNQALARRNRNQREAALRRSWRIVSRYLFALPLGNAQKLVQYIDAGLLHIIAGAPAEIARDQSWQVRWQAGATHQFNAIVCATGFHKPRFHAENNHLHLISDSTANCKEPEVSADLQMTLPGQREAERIWTLGVSSYLGAPLVNAVYQAVIQANTVAGQFFSDTQEQESCLAATE